MYAELHAISNYSFLQGASHPHELVERAAALGYQAIAITAECSFAGIVKAHEAAKKHNIKLIVGAQFQLTEGLFVLLAPNRRAYGQLSALITLARRRAEKGHYQLRYHDLISKVDECILLWRAPQLISNVNIDAVSKPFADDISDPTTRVSDSRLDATEATDANDPVVQRAIHSQTKSAESKAPTQLNRMDLASSKCRVSQEPQPQAGIPFQAHLGSDARCVINRRADISPNENTTPQGDDLQHYQHYVAELAAVIKRDFGKKLYMLMERNLQSGEGVFIPLWEQIALTQQIHCVAAGDVTMHSAERQMLQDVLSCIKNGTTLTEVNHAQLQSNSEHYLKPISALQKRYKAPWLAQTLAIAKLCHFSLDELKYEYPAEVVPPNMTASEYLSQEVRLGAQKRFAGGVPPKVIAQYERELTLITSLKYEYFFLTIYDIVRFAKSQHILHQGRGSAANSVVCYCLGITEVDPTKINMLFERFISKERDEPPDIDVDFEHERREEVIQYIYQKYGRARAALAATVISYRFKSAMGDVGKVLGLDVMALNNIIKRIDRRDPEHSWQSQLMQQGWVAQEGLGQFLLPLVSQIIGFPRHLSQHVGGFIIAAGPLSELVPIENAAMADRTVIQWDKDDIETLGLLKVDILALGMLTAIRKCFDLVSDFYKPFSMTDIMWEQREVYQMLQKGDSIGVFQVESRAQMSMLPRLKPANYYDLVIQIAIVRPGPIQGDMVHPYLRRRDGLEVVKYPSPAVEAVLSRTLGVPIFQEQVIQLAMVAAGFSGGEADQLRRAMASWKKNGELAKFEVKLLEGMASRGYSETFAQQIYRQIQGFGEYGFPESHSASFALLAYVSAYLKYHYPAAFFCALLNSQPMGFYSPSQLIQDAQRHCVTVLPVCVNHSQWQHTLVALAESVNSEADKPNKAQTVAIRLGFCAIKGLKKQPMDKLLLRRPISGFSQITDITMLGIEPSALASLASGNAFSCFAKNRYQARWQLSGYQPSLPLFDEIQCDELQFDAAHLPTDTILKTAASQLSQLESTPVSPQTSASSILSMSDEAYPQTNQSSEVNLPAPTMAESIMNDYRHLGFSLQAHPIALLRQAGLLPKCVTAASLQHCRHGQVVHVAGVVTGRQRPGTASGVTFITLEDETGNINLVVWMGTARAQRQAYLTSTILKVDGSLEREGDVVHLIAGRLENISSLMNNLDVSSRDFH